VLSEQWIVVELYRCQTAWKKTCGNSGNNCEELFMFVNFLNQIYRALVEESDDLVTVESEG
jgi:hypothetical protein